MKIKIIFADSNEIWFIFADSLKWTLNTAAKSLFSYGEMTKAYGYLVHCKKFGIQSTTTHTIVSYWMNRFQIDDDCIELDSQLIWRGVFTWLLSIGCYSIEYDSEAYVYEHLKTVSISLGK